MHAILFAAAAVAATIVAPEPPSDGYHYETVTLAPQVHVLVRPDPVRAPFEGNITVIEQSDGLVVVDAGGAPIGGQRAVAAIKAFSRKPVKFVIFTHWHPDHHLGAPAFKAAYPGVHFVTTPATRDAMIKVLIPIYKDYAKNFAPTGAFAAKRAADSALSDTERRRYAQLAADAPLITKAYQGVTLTLPDVTFTVRLSLPDTDAPVEVLFLGRGNTEGDAITFLPRQKVIVTGDLVVAPYPYGAESYPAEWIAVLKKLEGFDFTTLVPGHGEIQHDRTYVDAVIALIEDMRAQIDPLVAKKMGLDDIKKAVNFEKEMERFAGNDAFVRRLFNNFFIQPMIENCYHEAKGDAIVQE